MMRKRFSSVSENVNSIGDPLLLVGCPQFPQGALDVLRRVVGNLAADQPESGDPEFDQRVRPRCECSEQDARGGHGIEQSGKSGFKIPHIIEDVVREHDLEACREVRGQLSQLDDGGRGERCQAGNGLAPHRRRRLDEGQLQPLARQFRRREEPGRERARATAEIEHPHGTGGRGYSRDVS